MASISPPQAWWYLKKQRERRNALSEGVGVPSWVPTGAAAFFDRENDRYYLAPNEGSAAELLDPYIGSIENGAPSWMLPKTGIGITGDAGTIFLDLTFPDPATIGDFTRIFEYATDGSNRIIAYVRADKKTGVDVYNAGAGVIFVNSIGAVTTGLRMTIGIGFDASGIIYKFGLETEATASAAVPSGLNILGVNAQHNGGFGSGAALNALTVYNSRLAHAELP